MNTHELHPFSPTISFAATNSEFIESVHVDTPSLVNFMKSLGMSETDISETSIHFLPNVEQEQKSYDHDTKTIYSTTDMDGDLTRTSTDITLLPDAVKQKVDVTLGKMLTSSLVYGLNSRVKYVKYDAAVAEAKRRNRVKKPLYIIGASVGCAVVTLASAMETPNVYAASGVAALIGCIGASFITNQALRNKPPFRFATPQFPVGGEVTFPETSLITVSSRRLPL